MGKRWTNDEDIYLERFLYDNSEGTYRDIAKFLGRTVNAVKNRSVRLRDKNKNIGIVQKRWTDKEITYLKNTYTSLPTKKIAEHLNRSEPSVIIKANSLGIYKLKRVRDYDSEIRELAKQGLWQSEIARQLSLPRRSVAAYITKCGIQCGEPPENYRKMKLN